MPIRIEFPLNYKFSRREIIYVAASPFPDHRRINIDLTRPMTFSTDGGTGSSVATQFATDYHILIIQRNLSGVSLSLFFSLFLSLKPLNWLGEKEGEGRMKAEKYEICEMQSARAVHRNGDGWKWDRHVGRSSSIHS